MNLSETFEFKLTHGDGEEIVVKKTFPGGADIYQLAVLFYNFLKLITYGATSIQKVLNVEELSECNDFMDEIGENHD